MLPAALLFMVSCAASNDAVKKSLTNINEELVVIQKSLTDAQMNMEDIQSSSGNIQSDISTNSDAIAELRSEIAYLNNEILVLKGGKGADLANLDSNQATPPALDKNVGVGGVIVVEDKMEPMASGNDDLSQIVVVEDSGTTKNSLYSYAYELYHQKKYSDSRAKFEEFLQKYPNDQLSGNAQYWIGETYYSVDDMTNAMRAFQDVISKFPKSNKVPDAMLKIGYVYDNEKNRKQAIASLQKLVKQYPRSRPATLAKQKLRQWGA